MNHSCRDVNCMSDSDHACCGGPGCPDCSAERQRNRRDLEAEITRLRAQVEQLERENVLVIRPGTMTTSEDAQACAAWVDMLRRTNPTYWTDDRIRVTLFAHRQNMTSAVEAALTPEWEEAGGRVFATGNSGWTMVVREAIDMLRQAHQIAEQERDEERSDAAMYRNEFNTLLTARDQLVEQWKKEADDNDGFEYVLSDALRQLTKRHAAELALLGGSGTVAEKDSKK